jgi:hypothetical protein
MNTVSCKTIIALFLVLLIAGLYIQPPLVQALEDESLNADVPAESSKNLKDTTSSDSLKANVPAESPKALKDTTPSESLKAKVPQESSKELKDTTPSSESLNSEDAEAKSPCPRSDIKRVIPGAAKVGDTISLQGWRFGNDSGQVMFPDEVPAQISSWRNNCIDVIVPKEAKSGRISVTSACGAKSENHQESYFKVIEKQSGE